MVPDFTMRSLALALMVTVATAAPLASAEEATAASLASGEDAMLWHDPIQDFPTAPIEGSNYCQYRLTLPGMCSFAVQHNRTSASVQVFDDNCDIIAVGNHANTLNHTRHGGIHEVDMPLRPAWGTGRWNLTSPALDNSHFDASIRAHVHSPSLRFYEDVKSLQWSYTYNGTHHGHAEHNGIHSEYHHGHDNGTHHGHHNGTHNGTHHGRADFECYETRESHLFERGPRWACVSKFPCLLNQKHY